MEMQIDQRASPASEKDEYENRCEKRRRWIPSRITPRAMRRTKIDWSSRVRITSCEGRVAAIFGRAARTAETMASGGHCLPFLNTEQHASLSILAHNILLHGVSIATCANVVKVHRGTVNGLD